MRTIDLAWTEIDPEDKLKGFCETHRLSLSRRMSLESCEGSAHWHISKPGQRGTLELTRWPAKERLWMKVAANRDAPWIESIAALLADAIHER